MFIIPLPPVTKVLAKEIDFCKRILQPKISSKTRVSPTAQKSGFLQLYTRALHLVGDQRPVFGRPGCQPSRFFVI
jgi:hypothetical protein